MAWLLLILAGVFEAVWAIGMPLTHGFTRFWPSVIVVAAMIVSGVLLAHCTKSIPAGTAYSVWVAIGIVLTAIVEMGWQKGLVSVPRIAFLALLIVGIFGLKITGSPPDASATPVVSGGDQSKE